MQQDKSLIEKSSLPESFKLLPESKDDSKLAQLIKLESVECNIKNIYGHLFYFILFFSFREIETKKSKGHYEWFNI